MWTVVFNWLRRIIRIGILDFLSSLSWKVWAVLATVVVLGIGLIITLTILLVSIIF